MTIYLHVYSDSESAENTLLIKREQCCAVNDAQLSKLNGEKLLVTRDREQYCDLSAN